MHSPVRFEAEVERMLTVLLLIEEDSFLWADAGAWRISDQQETLM